MPKNDIEAFEYIASHEKTPLEIDFITYAMFAFKKKKWIEHFKNQTEGSFPTEDQINGWISQLSEFDFEQLRNDAAGFFDEAAKDYLKEFIENEKERAIKESIISEIKVFTNPWKHGFIAFVMAIVAPIVLGAALFLFSLADKSLPFHISIGPERPVEAPAQK